MLKETSMLLYMNSHLPSRGRPVWVLLLQCLCQRMAFRSGYRLGEIPQIGNNPTDLRRKPDSFMLPQCVSQVEGLIFAGSYTTLLGGRSWPVVFVYWGDVILL